MSHPEQPDLWIRYLDWSAAQIGKRLAELSPDEVWQAAHRGSARIDSSRPSISPPAAEAPSYYLDLVRAATLVIADELGLPPFHAWKEAYQRDPERYERDMLGVRPSAEDLSSPTT